MPTWLVVTLSVVTPMLAFAGSVTGSWWMRRSAVEEEVWRHREETLRMLRWGVELGTGDQARPGAAGIATLRALVASELVQPEDELLVRIVTQAVLEPDRAEYDEAKEFAGELTVVVEEEGDSV